jgi:hypothetical protein
MDLFAVQRMHTGTYHWDVTTEKKVCTHFEKSIIKFTKVLPGIAG